MAIVKHDEYTYRGIKMYCWKVLPKKGTVGYYWTVDIGNLPVHKTDELVNSSDGFKWATMWIDRVVDHVLELVTDKVHEI